MKHESDEKAFQRMYLKEMIGHLLYWLVFSTPFAIRYLLDSGVEGLRLLNISGGWMLMIWIFVSVIWIGSSVVSYVQKKHAAIQTHVRVDDGVVIYHKSLYRLLSLNVRYEEFTVKRVDVLKLYYSNAILVRGEIEVLRVRDVHVKKRHCRRLMILPCFKDMEGIRTALMTYRPAKVINVSERRGFESI